MENELIQNMRSSYTSGKLEKEDLLADPIELMKNWLEIAVKANTQEPTAMSLSTVNENGQPSSRTVLLKEFDAEGFIFYTNYKSRKSSDLEANNKAALLFFWADLERQVRIEGSIKKVSREQSNIYFQSRPKGSQIGAWASPQSEVISDRKLLNDRVRELSNVYKNEDRLPLPPFWGGYILLPKYFEFWQGRENRMHDRFEYNKSEKGWTIKRLAP